MTQITLNIPDNELSFFMKLIEKLNYETVINEFSINQELMNLLDERRTTAKTDDFIPWNDAKNQLQFKSKG